VPLARRFQQIARLTWRSDCLRQAEAGRRWLGRHGVKSEIRLGARKDDAGLPEMHAWLIVGKRVVTGGDIATYTALWRAQGTTSSHPPRPITPVGARGSVSGSAINAAAIEQHGDRANPSHTHAISTSAAASSLEQETCASISSGSKRGITQQRPPYTIRWQALLNLILPMPIHGLDANCAPLSPKFHIPPPRPGRSVGISAKEPPPPNGPTHVSRNRQSLEVMVAATINPAQDER
jgi:hypothetical protein